MNVLVVGSGAREHAIVWKCRQSKLVDRLFCAPGNAGIAQTVQCVDIAADDIEGLAAFAKDFKIDLTIVGPEIPLMLGIVDRFEEEDLVVLGPTKDAALIEGSKIFAKNLLEHCGLKDKTASYRFFANPERAREYIRDRGVPCVIKANGLASGKGVIVAKTVKEGELAVDRLMAQEGHRLILIEDFLDGWECSYTVLTDGWNILIFPVSCDYKQDLFGNNTGGVGSFSPVSALSREYEDEIYGYVRKVLDALREMGRPYKGFLYPGVIITKNGPKFLEFNCRLGDPEAQVLLPRFAADFVDLCYAVAKGNLFRTEDYVRFSSDAFVNVVIAALGYPRKPETGHRIYGLRGARKEGALVLHAGTALDSSNKLITSGGRVISVVGRGDSIYEAREMAYRGARHISFGNKNPKKGRQWYREDIALNV